MPRSLALLALLLLPAPARAAGVAGYDCTHNGSRASCRIRIEGEVQPGDRLFLSRVHDRDTLTYQGRTLGATGSFVGRDFHAGFFPRVYSLDPLAGVRSPVLTLEVEGGLMHAAGIPGSARVKVIDGTYPLRRILGPAVFQLASFFFLAGLCFYLFAWARRKNGDGWLYPPDELRWFLGGLGVFLLLSHEVSGLLVPLVWSARLHLLSQRMALLVALWSGTILLLGGRFSDRSCIERGRTRVPLRSLRRLAHAGLLLPLAALAFVPDLGERTLSLLLAAPLVPMLLAQARAARNLEWRRVLKRSSLAPLLFHLALLAFPAGLALTVARTWLGGAGDQRPLEIAGWCLVLLAGLRMRSYARAGEKSRELAWECRDLMLDHAGARQRLQVLCDFVADEWGAARVSVISVDTDVGFVLTSAGPEAIPDAGRAEPRRLGPFLRRVCKQAQMLYAPVAEELGQDLRSQGLKHSSLAIPLSQERQVRAVVCMMADEGERIPPGDAGQLELFVETLSLEILSAVGQQVSDNRTSHLLEIARTADALAVENLDHWGHFRESKEAATRVVLGGDSIAAGPFFDQLRKSPVLGRVWAAYRAETRSVWTAVAAAFEFIPKDNRDDFWVISPRTFRNPLLRDLGPERAAVLLASVLERHARSIAAKDGYAVLGYCGVRLAGGAVNLRRSSWHGSAVEIDSDEFGLLLDLRGRAHPGTILFVGDAPALAAPGEGGFHCRFRPWDGIPGRQIFSILWAAADKKEVRKLESQALEKARGLSRKAA
jgi:hypothetical protein